MSWLSRVLSVVRRTRVERELDDEIRFHLEERAAELSHAGLSDADAREHARRRFGSPLRVRESSRDIKLLPWLESIVRDVGFGLRLCRRNRIATAAAITSLSLAIGACTAAFSLIDALILRPLPVADPQSLVYIAQRTPSVDHDGLSFNYPLFGRLRDAGRPHVRLFALSDQSRQDATIDGSQQPEKLYGQWISGDALGILGVRPALGRLLAPSDDVVPGRHPVAVVSHEFWTRRFGGRPDVLGRWITLRDKPLRIVGVAERGFTGVEAGIRTDVWAPMMMWDDRAISDPSTRWFRIWGRIEPGAAPDRAQAVLQTVFTGFRREQAAALREESRERIEQFLDTRLHLRPAAHGPSALRESFERALWVLAGVAVLVLLIASANVAGLLVARAAAREREMALRVSIGAGRGRLVQQVLIESALLAVASCAAGAVLAMVIAPAVVSMLSPSRAVAHLNLGPDWRMLAFLAVAGSLVAGLFGLAPAIRASAVSPGDALKSDDGRHTARAGLFRPLVAAQVAFGFVVLFVAGLCLSSFGKLLRTDLGFDRHQLALVDVSVGTLRQGPGETLALWRQLLERLARVPGVESASLSPWGLFEGSGRNKSVRIPGRVVDAYMPWYLGVSPGFLATMRIPLLAGRDLDWRDAASDGPAAVIVNDSFVRRYFPGESPLGRRFFRIDGGSRLTPQEIVGVARDAKYTSIREDAPPTVYEAYLPEEAAVVQVRTRLDAAALRAALGTEVPLAHPAFRVVDVTLQSTLVDDALVRDRALALLSAFFSLVTIALVFVGLYGVLSYGVTRRTREIGIRLALGAPRLRVLRLVLSEVGAMTIVGVAMGAGGAVLAARFVAGLLFDVEPSNPWSITAPLLGLLAACAASALAPAWRAIRVDPTSALRHE